MDDELNRVSSHRAVRLAEKFHDKEYRDTYVESHTRRFLAHQMREFRDGESQTVFGVTIDKSQTIVSRLEDPTYSGWTLRTIFDVAKKLNVAAVVRFVDFGTFLNFTDDTSTAALRPPSYEESTVDYAAVAVAATDNGFSYGQDCGTQILDWGNNGAWSAFAAVGGNIASPGALPHGLNAYVPHHGALAQFAFAPGLNANTMMTADQRSCASREYENARLKADNAVLRADATRLMEENRKLKMALLLSGVPSQKANNVDDPSPLSRTQEQQARPLV